MQESLPAGVDEINPQVHEGVYLRVMDFYEARRLIVERLIKERFGGNQAEFSRAIKTSPTTVNRWLKEAGEAHRKRIGDDSALKIEEMLDLRQGTLLNPVIESRGERILLSTKSETPKAIPLDNNPDYPAIPRVQFKLAAGVSGFGVDYLVEDAAPIVFRKDWYDGRGLDPVKLYALRVSGQSMEPGLWDGDTVVVNSADTQPSDGDVFALNYEGELVIKRMLRDEGSWWMVSDNPDQRRYPRKRCHEDTFVLGRIVHKQSERI